MGNFHRPIAADYCREEYLVLERFAVECAAEDLVRKALFDLLQLPKQCGKLTDVFGKAVVSGTGLVRLKNIQALSYFSKQPFAMRTPTAQFTFFSRIGLSITEMMRSASQGAKERVRIIAVDLMTILVDHTALPGNSSPAFVRFTDLWKEFCGNTLETLLSFADFSAVDISSDPPSGFKSSKFLGMEISGEVEEVENLREKRNLDRLSRTDEAARADDLFENFYNAFLCVKAKAKNNTRTPQLELRTEGPQERRSEQYTMMIIHGIYLENLKGKSKALLTYWKELCIDAAV